jgi:hypothetical protein
MDFMRRHWWNVAGVMALAGLLWFGLSHDWSGGLSLGDVLWLSLISLWVHQFEEYGWPGGFPTMLNRVLFASTKPDRFPLNAQSALVVNVGVGWGSYGLAALFGEQLPWLGIATILVSVGNTIAHTFLFNIKGRTLYNPGMATALLLFVPISILFYLSMRWDNLFTPLNLALGIPLGLLLNYVGILKVIDWMKDADRPFGVG